MAAADLARPAMAAPVMGYDAVALLDEVEHLRIPVVAAQGPAVMKDDRLAGAPVLVVDLDAAGVIFPNINVIHSQPPFLGGFSMGKPTEVLLIDYNCCSLIAGLL
jgi:hypothetical protein